MSDGPWTYDGDPPNGGDAPGTTTLIDGTTFCISDGIGDIAPGTTHGMFVRDTRFVSTWRLRVDGAAPEQLSIVALDLFSATFVSRVPPSASHPEASLLIERQRSVGEGMIEALVVRNLGGRTVACILDLELATDFSHVYEVRERRRRPDGHQPAQLVDGRMVVASGEGERARALVLDIPDGAEVERGRLRFRLEIAPRSRFRTCFSFTVVADGAAVQPRHHCGEELGASVSAGHVRAWRQSTPRVEADLDRYTLALARSEEDLGALRIFAPDDERGLATVAAGAPWYMALFGRDSLITSLMSLVVDPTITLATLGALARRQGQRHDPVTEEQPGRILHELRSESDGRSGRRALVAYYGSADATPLFVMLLDAAYRWGLPRDELAAFIPHADAALEWLLRDGDRDGDGFVEYGRSSGQGLVNQGWKDSVDGVNFADGSLPTAPIALCEVQGYAYAAWRARAEIARAEADKATAERCEERAAALKRSFNERFWLAERGYFAIGLDADKRPIDALTSNIGHLLWTGIVEADKAAAVAAHLVSPPLFSGFGIRTLADTMGAYNPMSYHNGSVWPHDSAIAIAGLMRYGFVTESQQVALGLIDAAAAFDSRLPELFCGFDRREFPEPIAYPSACAPQAWSAASLFSVLQTMLRLEPDLPQRCVRIAPALPGSFGRLSVADLALGADRVVITAARGICSVEGLSEGVTLLEDAAPALDA